MKLARGDPILLSNFEVLNHFLERKSENDQLKRITTDRKNRRDQALRTRYPVTGDEERYETQTFAVLSSEEDAAGKKAEGRVISDEAIWLQDKVLHYLCEDWSGTGRQTEEGVRLLTDTLQDHDLAKAEVLQIVNLTPTQAVQVYPLIESISERWDDQQLDANLDSIVNMVSESLLPDLPQHLKRFTPAGDATGDDDDYAGEDVHNEYNEIMEEEQEYVTEATWGANKEDGVGEEVENDME